VAEKAFAFELEFLAFVVELGEFLDAGEDILEDDGPGMGAGKFEGFFVEEMVDHSLDAGGLVEVGFFLEVGNDVDHRFGGASNVLGSKLIAQPTECGEVHFHAEALGRRSGDAAMDIGKIFKRVHPIHELEGLVIDERTEKGVAALFALERLDFAFEEWVGRWGRDW